MTLILTSPSGSSSSIYTTRIGKIIGRECGRKLRAGAALKKPRKSSSNQLKDTKIMADPETPSLEERLPQLQAAYRGLERALRVQADARACVDKAKIEVAKEWA